MARWACMAAICAVALMGVSFRAVPSLGLDPSDVVTDEPITRLPMPDPSSPLRIALGERLFQDPRLSRGNTRSCASCHDLDKNGSSSEAHDIGLDGAPLPLNTLTVFNAALSFRLNWEGQFRTLEDQAAASIENPRIMGSTLAEVVEKLAADPETADQFRAAYRRDPDEASLLDALASFERSLVTPNSRFDRWLGGDDDALSAREAEGYALFKSLGCVSCHQGVNVGGNLFQRHGIFHPLASPKPEILRVPSLRNVATTPPYFHDGSASTLQEAVRKMGLAQLNSELTDEQIDKLAAYLRSLTGEFRGQPVGGPP